MMSPCATHNSPSSLAHGIAVMSRIPLTLTAPTIRPAREAWAWGWPRGSENVPSAHSDPAPLRNPSPRRLSSGPLGANPAPSPQQPRSPWSS